jgi:hypothetical protein
VKKESLVGINAGAENIPQIQSLKKFLTDAGRSRTTGYRWRQLGYLTTVSVCGRPYVTRDGVMEFLKRAAAGELSGNAVIKPIGANNEGGA